MCVMLQTLQPRRGRTPPVALVAAALAAVLAHRAGVLLEVAGASAAAAAAAAAVALAAAAAVALAARRARAAVGHRRKPDSDEVATLRLLQLRQWLLFL
jgi:hypothetical protein